MQNYTTKQERLYHLNTLVQEAIEFEKKLSEAETVGREEVEKAMLEKLNWSRMANDELRKLKETIKREDEKLREAYEELEKLLKYKVIHSIVKYAYINLCVSVHLVTSSFKFLKTYSPNKYHNSFYPSNSSLIRTNLTFNINNCVCFTLHMYISA